ncbi:MAG: protein-disulfide reductase DsbD family protein [Planctomycetota bacterium]
MICLVAMLWCAPQPAPQTTQPMELKTYVNRAEVAPGAELKLAIELTITKGWHLGAHEVRGAQVATTLALTAADGVDVAQTVFPPGRELTYAGERIQAYEGTQLIGALLRIDSRVKPGSYAIKGELEYQACNDRGQCLLPEKRALAIAIVVAASPQAGEQQPELFSRLAFKPELVRGEQIRYRAYAVPGSLSAGGAGEVVVEIAVDAGWHLYGLHSKAGYATRLALIEGASIEPAGEPTEPEPIARRNDVLEETELIHEGTVLFHLPIKVKPDVAAGRALVQVELHYQVCDLARCLMPKKLVLEAPLTIALAAGAH